MIRYDVQSSPQVYARTGGALYLILIVLGAFAEGVRDRLIVADNAVATAANLTSISRCGGWGLPPNSSG